MNADEHGWRSLVTMPDDETQTLADVLAALEPRRRAFVEWLGDSWYDAKAKLQTVEMSGDCDHDCGREATLQHADGRLLCFGCYRSETDYEPEEFLVDCPTCGDVTVRGEVVHPNAEPNYGSGPLPGVEGTTWKWQPHAVPLSSEDAKEQDD